MLDGIGASTAWAILQRQGDSLATRFAAQKGNQADMARFRQRAAEITSVDELMRDRRTLTVVLEAFQLEGEIDKRAVIRKLLTEDPTDGASFANRMVDPRYRQISAAFGGRTGAPLGSGALVEKVVRAAVTNRFEKAAGDGNSGLREALYFQRSIAQVGSIPALMSDTALTAVVKGALGLPSAFGLLDYERQRDMLAKRLDPTTFTDAKAMGKLVQRYLVQAGENAGTSGNPMLSLFGGGASGQSLLSLIA